MSSGTELRNFRAAVGMKQEVAASHLGISQAYVSRLESGTARPSLELAERIRKLIDTPKHRPHFEHWRATVIHSPHLVMLSSLQGDDVRIEALSAQVRTEGPPWELYRPGHLISEELGPAAIHEIKRLIALGVFTGDVSCVDGLWYSRTSEQVRYWRTINVPVRDQLGNWYLHSTSVESSQADHEARLARHSETLLVSLFDREGAVPARDILGDMPPEPPRR